MESHTLQQFIEQMPAAIAIFDRELRYLAVSRRHLSELALLFSTEILSPDKVIGRTFFEVSPEAPARWGDVFARVLAGEDLAQEEDFVPRQDGRAVWLRWAVKPWRNVYGQIGGALLFGEVITQRVEIRHALAESESRARATFENAAVGIAHISSNLRWLMANETLCRIVGWPIKELVTKSLQDIVHPDDLEAELGYVQQMIDGKINKFEMEKRCLRKDGGFVWTLLALSCVRKSDRSIDYFVGVIQDISARKRAEKELGDSEARFRATFDKAAIGIAHVDTDGRYLRVNPVVSRIYRYTADELATMSFHDTIHPDYLAAYRARFELMREGKIDSFDMEMPCVRKDGAIVWGRKSVGRVLRDDGSIDYFVVVIEDISTRKRAEKELSDSEARFRATFDKAAVGIAHVDTDGRYLRVNPVVSRIYGYTADELATMSFHDTIHPDYLAAYRARFELMREGKIDSFDMEMPCVRKDGAIVWGRKSVGRVLRNDGSIDYFVVVIEDISARKRAEEQIHLLMREANHRARNMLGLVQVIARQTAAGKPEDFVRRFTERIQALAANQDLLARNQHQGADLQDLVRTHLAHFADLVGSRITAIGPKLNLNATAAQAIGLALHELATNAGKYGALSTDMGRVDIGWAMTDDTFTMSWIERSGPPVRPPERKGFGSMVIDSMARQMFGCEVQLDYAPSGLGWRLTCPAVNALEATAEPASKSSNAPTS